MTTLLTYLPGIVLASTFNFKSNSEQGTKLGGLTLPGIITALLSLLLLIAALVFFFMLIIGGVKWILSGGDKAQAESARNQITAALIGLVIVFAAWAIANLIGAFFDVNIFNFTIPTVTS
jgi:cbb3-type cytochrome oxidase subunit 3